MPFKPDCQTRNMDRDHTQRRHRWPTGGHWGHGARNVMRQLKSLWKAKPAEPSFRVIRVVKIGSVTAPIMHPRATAAPTPKTSTLGAPASFQRGLFINDQGEWEYRSLYRTGMAAARQQPQPPTARIVTRTRYSLGPAKPYLPYRPSPNIHPLPKTPRDSGLSLSNLVHDATSNDVGFPSGRLTPTFAHTGPVGTPLRQPLVPGPITLPKAVHRQLAYDVPVGEWWRGSQPGGPVIAERQHTHPCGPPLTAVTQASTTSPDDRTTLPSQQLQEIVVLPRKIARPGVRPEVTRQEPQAAPRPQPRLRRRPGLRSLRRIALANMRNNRISGTQLPRQE